MKRLTLFGIVILAVLVALGGFTGCAKKPGVKEQPMVGPAAGAAVTAAKPGAAAVDQAALDREKALREQALREQAERERLAREQAAREAAEKERALKEAIAKACADVFFDFDKYNLKPEARETLKACAAKLNEMKDLKVVIEGHCDERGSVEYNLALGDRRATETKKYLLDLGVDKTRLETISYGKERPVDPGKTEEAYAKNRRAHFVIDLAK